MFLLIISFLILITSFLFAMLGLGGGMIYVPILKWAGLNYKEVVIPMGLLLNGLNTLLALIPYHKAKLVDYKGMWSMGLTAMIFSPIGARVTPFISKDRLVLIFATFVALAATKVFYDVFKKRKHRKDIETESISTNVHSLKKKQWLGALTGSIVGFVGGLLGIGGGFIIAPVLMALGYETKRAAATTAFVVTFSSFSGYLGHIGNGLPMTWLTLALIMAVIIGSQLGSRYMINKAKGMHIKVIYGVLLIFIAIKLVVEIA